MALLLVIFVLRNTGVYISIINSGDVTINIEIFIKKHFYIQAILKIPDISSYNYYVQF